MKNAEDDFSWSGILTAVFGLVLLIMPTLTNKIIVYGIGVALLVCGAVRVVRYVRRDPSEAMMNRDLSAGLICVATGLFMLLYSGVVISILPFLFGLFLLFGGALSIQTSFDIKRFGGSRWKMHLVIGIVFVVLGATAIRNPFGAASALTRFVGACLLLEGVYMFVAGRRVRSLRDAFMREDNVIDADQIK